MVNGITDACTSEVFGLNFKSGFFCGEIAYFHSNRSLDVHYNPSSIILDGKEIDLAIYVLVKPNVH